MNNFGYGIKFADLYQRDGLVKIIKVKKSKKAMEFLQVFLQEVVERK